MKLYPPYIEGKLPAFSLDEKQTFELAIPFQLNPAVGEADFYKMAILIKTMSGKEILSSYLDEAEEEKYFGSYQKFNNIYKAVFPSIQKDLFQIGQFYKIQIAFINSDKEIGYYSTVGIIKCTAAAEATILGLETGIKNSNPINFTGVYSTTDNSEKPYSYKFNVYDEKHNLYATSGEQIHNNIDEWVLDKRLQENKTYSIEYIVTTNNLQEVKSEEYLLIDSLLVNMKLPLEIHASFDAENGKVIIKLNKNKQDDVVNGTYKIVRASNEDNYTEWVDLFDLKIANEALIDENNSDLEGSNNESILQDLEDFTLKHGVTYKYAVQRYNKYNVRSVREGADENVITANFEDMFLFDGKKQLRIAFNPKVSSFKTTLQEAKIDTLGGKYPFFYRNGALAYKEFPISGLISIHMDQNLQFFDEKKVNHPSFSEDGFGNRHRSSTPSKEENIATIGTSLTAETMKIERDFKLEVLEWLTNGEPKLFRSPAEGNYYVRLMNTSLSPEEKLGRMIHTFNSTAYEVGKADYKSLVASGLIKDCHIEKTTVKMKKPDFIYKKNINDGESQHQHFGKKVKTFEILSQVGEGTIILYSGDEPGVQNMVPPNKITLSKYQRWDNIEVGGLSFRFAEGEECMGCTYQYEEIKDIPEDNEFDSIQKLIISQHIIPYSDEALQKVIEQQPITLIAPDKEVIVYSIIELITNEGDSNELQ